MRDVGEGFNSIRRARSRTAAGHAATLLPVLPAPAQPSAGCARRERPGAVSQDRGPAGVVRLGRLCVNGS